MEFQKVIEARRSVRKYDPTKKLTEETIKELVDAAILAPSWKNAQTARYHCIMSAGVLEKFKANCLPEFNAENAADAPALIVTTFIKNRAGYERTGEPSNELGNGWGAYDLGLHNQNLVLKAQDMGLSTIIMGIRHEGQIRQLLNIDEQEIIVAVIAVGYSQASPEMPNRKAAEDILRFV